MQTTGAVQAQTTRTKVPASTLLLMIPAFLLIVAFFVLKLVDPAWYRLLIREDGPFENLTALAYLAASITAGLVAFSLLRRGDRLFAALYLALTLGFFVIAGEEISWGQRIFQVQSPEFFLQYNDQQELNVHNFLSQHLLHGAYIVVAFLLAFGWYLVPKLLPRFPARVRSLVEPKLWMLLPDWRLMLYAIPCMVFYFYYDYVNPIVWRILGPQWNAFDDRPGNFFLPKDQETLELFLAIGFFLFVVMVFQRLLKTSKTTPRA